MNMNEFIDTMIYCQVSRYAEIAQQNCLTKKNQRKFESATDFVNNSHLRQRYWDILGQKTTQEKSTTITKILITKILSYTKCSCILFWAKLS